MTRNLRNRKGNPEDLVMSALAERLREAAENRDVGELATKVGVTPVTFYRWMSAKFDPGVAKLSELAEALNVSLAWLITGQAPMGRRQAIRHARLADYGRPNTWRLKVAPTNLRSPFANLGCLGFCTVMAIRTRSFSAICSRRCCSMSLTIRWSRR